MMIHSSLAQLHLRNPLPAAIYAINAVGVPRPFGVLHEEWPDTFAVTRHRLGTAPPRRITGPSKVLPYYLQDSRPTGYLGRKVPAAYPELGLPPLIEDWKDSHALRFLTRFGSQNVGNLVIGDESLYRYQTLLDEPPLIGAKDRSREYPRLADAHSRTLLGAGIDGSNPSILLPGEQPKFAARILDDHRVRSVIVKFSSRRDTQVGLRSADMLLAEWLASKILTLHGFKMARSAPHAFDGRVFLEIDRFDRLGTVGRRGVSSLFSIDAARYGKLDTWSLAAERLHRDNLLRFEDFRQIKALECFSGLIGNIDRHLANITMYDGFADFFGLAPIYGVLPKAFAPFNGTMPTDQFRPQGPSRDCLKIWPGVLTCAKHYWAAMELQDAVSDSFRNISSDCLQAVQAMRVAGVK